MTQLEQMDAFAKMLIEMEELKQQVSDLKCNQKTRPPKQELHPVECELCHHVFKNKYILKTHMNNIHNDKRKRFECPECHKLLASKYYLITHMALMHYRPEESDPPADTCPPETPETAETPETPETAEAHENNDDNK